MIDPNDVASLPATYRWGTLGVERSAQIDALLLTQGWTYQPCKWDFLFSVGQFFGVFHKDQLIGSGGVHNLPHGALVVMIVVDPTHSGQGLGRALTVEAIRRAGSSPSYLYATEMGQRVYAKLGFRVQEHSFLYEGQLSGRSAKSTQVRPGTLAELKEFDSRIYGGARTELLDSLWARRHQCLVACESEEVVAAGLAYLEEEQLVVGPVMAPEQRFTQALVESLVQDQSFQICLTQHHHAANSAWLQNSGMKLVSQEPLMAREGWSAPPGWHSVVAIPGFAYG